ncbi:MAG: hypothetical protein EPO02_04385 [Nitrospirae bacterium]|nr:MAG: hypothetical protein EPO02_04385 [Nitrospirota bacterium]
MTMPTPPPNNDTRSAALSPLEERLPQKSGERDRMVRAEQVKLLYAKAPMVVTATLVNAPILVFILWEEVRHVVLISWLLYMITLSLGRAWLGYEYWLKPPSPIKESRWGAWYLAGVALSGLGWGAVGVFLFPNASLPHQMFLAFVLAGMTAGSVAACSAMMAGFLLFAVPVFIPFVIKFLAQGDDLHLAMGAMIALYAILLVFIARAMNRTLLASLHLRFENRDLVAYLSAAKGRADRLNDELTCEIDERKRVQKERERLITELQDALANIKVLHGLLPICSHCKKIRDDEGGWHMVEVYVREHSNADFSHSICPECLNRMYPEFGKKNNPPD